MQKELESLWQKCVAFHGHGCGGLAVGFRAVLYERNRITYNEPCRKCSNDCKQSFRCIVVLCPKYLSKRRTKKDEADGK